MTRNPTVKMRIVTTLDGYEAICAMCDELGSRAPLLRRRADGTREQPDVIILDGQRSGNAVIIGWDELPHRQLHEKPNTLVGMLSKLDGKGIPWQYVAMDESSPHPPVFSAHGQSTPQVRLEAGIMSVFDHDDGDVHYSSVIYPTAKAGGLTLRRDALGSAKG